MYTALNKLTGVNNDTYKDMYRKLPGSISTHFILKRFPIRNKSLNHVTIIYD